MPDPVELKPEAPKGDQDILETLLAVQKEQKDQREVITQLIVPKITAPLPDEQPEVKARKNIFRQFLDMELLP
jgi:hypothetical protein